MLDIDKGDHLSSIYFYITLILVCLKLLYPKPRAGILT